MKHRAFAFSRNQLKILAIILMLIDHVWASFIGGNFWLTYIGRMAFPIFAFQAFQGYKHTSDVKKYKSRLLMFALISEIPFNLFVEGSLLYPFHQNVIFTMLLGVCSIEAIDKIIHRERPVKNAFSLALFLLFGMITFPDYGIQGVIVVIMFFLLHRGNYKYLELPVLFVIFQFFSQGLYIPIGDFELQVETFCIFGLPFIWLYDENKDNKANLKYFGYWFYPVHMLVLYAIARLLT